jgi:hypothetical protein
MTKLATKDGKFLRTGCRGGARRRLAGLIGRSYRLRLARWWAFPNCVHNIISLRDRNSRPCRTGHCARHCGVPERVFETVARHRCPTFRKMLRGRRRSSPSISPQQCFSCAPPERVRHTAAGWERPKGRATSPSTCISQAAGVASQIESPHAEPPGFGGLCHWKITRALGLRARALEILRTGFVR